LKLSNKDLNLAKGALRRAFTKSEIYKQIRDAHVVEHSDPNRPRVSRWAWCASCGEIFPAYTGSVDHIAAIIPLDKLTEEMTIGEIAEAIYCDPSNLQFLCQDCHTRKTLGENAIRRENKKKRRLLSQNNT
jgi:5-methylcytosine-specific restriction endonuclease McrA